MLSITIVACINENIFVNNIKQWWGISRNVFYNSYALMDITLWCVAFFFIYRSSRILRVLVIVFWCGLMSMHLNDTLSHGLHYLPVSSLTFFCAGCILFSTFYFTTVLKAAHYNLRHHYAFWICCASFCFHPILLVNLLTVPDPNYWGNHLATVTFDILQFIAVTFYNIFLCIAFLFSFYKYRRNSSQTLL